MKRERKSEEEAARYGFRWGQLDVTRAMEFRGQKCILIETEFDIVQVYVSPKGRSIRVWHNHKELT